MSAFIVISIKDSLNWIVDGIVKCRPHNPEVMTYISTGKVKKIEGDNYEYEYTVYSKHTEENDSDGVVEKTNESDTPRNLFGNQIAHFLNVCENEGEQVNVFLLDNPMTEDDFKQSNWLIDELYAVYESRSVTNFQIVRVLFSYQIDRPSDVNRQVSAMVLKQLTEMDLSDTADCLMRVLYLDNQNRSGAAICLDRQSHDIMLPRMLCDLMMLMSNKDDAYNTATAVSGDTRVFSVGYSECMYYHDDVFNCLKLNSDYDLHSYILNDKNENTSLDFEEEPFGLADRQTRLAKVYEPVPFESDINLFSDSIDKSIDDILTSFKEDIVAIKSEAMIEAVEADRVATDKARREKLAELVAASGDVDADNSSQREPYGDKSENSGCMPFSHLIKRFRNRKKTLETDTKETVDPRVVDIVITSESERAQHEYPEYIDRTCIYEQYMQEKVDGEYFEGVPFDTNVESYKKLLGFIQSGKFLRYLKSKGSGNTWPQDKVRIDSIPVLYGEREKYFRLKKKVDELREICAQKKKIVDGFHLTNHCSSVNNLIDVDGLKNYYLGRRDSIVADVMKRWQNRDSESRKLSAIQERL